MQKPFLILVLLILNVLTLSTAALLPSYFLYHKHTLSSTCSDGSPAIFYHRNCTANGDRKPGDPTDFCEGIQTFVVHFLSEDIINQSSHNSINGAFCYDDISCAARAKRAPSLTSSKSYPDTLFIDGLTSPFPEVNPNLYKQHSILVPYCTSDLWAGKNGGAAIVNDVITALAFTPLIGDSGLRNADRLVLVGSTGIMARLDELSIAFLNAKKNVTGNVSAVLEIEGICDSCALAFPPFPPLPFPPPPCTTDFDCPAILTLPKLALYSSILRPQWCPQNIQISDCFAGSQLISSLNSSHTPALILTQQYDKRQAASYGAGGQSKEWLLTSLAPALRKLALLTPFAVAPACSLPSSFASSASIFSTKVKHTNQYNVTINATVISALTSFLELSGGGGGGGSSDFGTWIDSCKGDDCSTFCEQ
jgi:hypothetical protein